MPEELTIPCIGMIVGVALGLMALATDSPKLITLALAVMGGALALTPH